MNSTKNQTTLSTCNPLITLTAQIKFARDSDLTRERPYNDGYIWLIQPNTSKMVLLLTGQKTKGWDGTGHVDFAPQSHVLVS